MTQTQQQHQLQPSLSAGGGGGGGGGSGVKKVCSRFAVRVSARGGDCVCVFLSTTPPHISALTDTQAHEPPQHRGRVIKGSMYAPRALLPSWRPEQQQQAQRQPAQQQQQQRARATAQRAGLRTPDPVPGRLHTDVQTGEADGGTGWTTEEGVCKLRRRRL